MWKEDYAVVYLDGGHVGLEAITDDHDVVTTTERVGVDSPGFKENLRVLTRGLAGRRTIEVPHGAVYNRAQRKASGE